MLWEFTTSSVLTMEYCKGGKVNDSDYIKQHGISPRQVTSPAPYLAGTLPFYAHGYLAKFVFWQTDPGNIKIS